MPVITMHETLSETSPPPHSPQPRWSFVPSGDRCLVIRLADDDIMAANRLACALGNLVINSQLPGITDVVPSMAAVGIHYDPAAFRAERGGPTTWEKVCRSIDELIARNTLDTESRGKEVVIPVCYGGEHGQDLDDVARQCNMTAEEVIQLHSSSEVSVLMLGFAPGHPHIGLFDERLAIPRRKTPRTAVPPGSIGLAIRQSVIYPSVLPGGWSLIGRTPLKMFDPLSDKPCRLDVGDRVRFEAISPAEFDQLAAREGLTA